MTSTSLLHRAWEWPGYQLMDPDGEKIGEVLEVYVDAATGEPAWLAISTGWFGTRVSLVPVTDISPAGEHHLVTTWSKEQVQEAPHVAADGELSEDEERALFAYYGVEYVDFAPDPADGRDPNAEVARQRAWEARLRRHQRAAGARSPGAMNEVEPTATDWRGQPRDTPLDPDMPR